MKKLCLLIISLLCVISASAQNWAKVQKIVASDRYDKGVFGGVVAISNHYAVIGAIGNSTNTSGGDSLLNAGAAYIFERNTDGNWVEVQKLVASDREADDRFGHAVSICNDYAIVGTRKEDHDAAGGNYLEGSGSAYIFERDMNGNWVEVQKIVAADRAEDDEFGYAVGISGNTVIVGAHLEDEDPGGGNTINAAGSAYIFNRDSSGTWNQKQKLIASDREIADYFGDKVSISGDLAIISAYLEDEDSNAINTKEDAGSAYIFERDSSNTWVEVQKIVANDRGAGTRFGSSVSINGSLAIVGAEREHHDASGGDSIVGGGAAYIFERDPIGNWSQVQKIAAFDRAMGDIYGRSVAITQAYALVGAYAEDQDSLGANFVSEAGSAYLYKRDGQGNWNHTKKLTGQHRGSQHYFGYSVAMDDQIILIGAVRDTRDLMGMDSILWSGAGYFFEETNSVSISHPELLSKLTIYPNPSQGKITIEFGQVYNEISISITTLLGETVFSDLLRQQERAEIDISGPPGLYLIEIHTDTEERALIKMLKM